MEADDTGADESVNPSLSCSSFKRHRVSVACPCESGSCWKALVTYLLSGNDRTCRVLSSWHTFPPMLAFVLHKPNVKCHEGITSPLKRVKSGLADM